jgi:hypothetical protein
MTAMRLDWGAQWYEGVILKTGVVAHWGKKDTLIVEQGTGQLVSARYMAHRPRYQLASNPQWGDKTIGLIGENSDDDGVADSYYEMPVKAQFGENGLKFFFVPLEALTRGVSKEAP